jgi:hypothetical protein
VPPASETPTTVAADGVAVAPVVAIDPVVAAAEAEARKQAAEAAYAKALADAKTSAELSAAAAGDIMRRGRGQLAELGMVFWTHFDECMASGLVPWDNAGTMLRSALSLETGESVDLGRPMQVSSAADFFGRAAFVALPVDSQRTLAALFNLVPCLDDAGKPNGRKAYVLAGLGNNDAIKAFRYACGEDKAEAATFVPAARYSKHGHMQQEDVRTVVEVIKRAASAATKDGAKTVADGVTAKPAALANVARGAIAEKEAAKVERSERRELVSALLNAHNGKGDAPAKGESKADAKDVDSSDAVASGAPHGRAVAIVHALTESADVCNAFAKTVTEAVFADVFAAMTNAGRVADLQLIRRKLNAELLLAERIAANGGPGKMTRSEAKKSLKAEPAAGK